MLRLKQIAVCAIEAETFLYGLSDSGQVYFYDTNLRVGTSVREGWSPLTMLTDIDIFEAAEQHTKETKA